MTNTPSRKSAGDKAAAKRSMRAISASFALLAGLLVVVAVAVVPRFLQMAPTNGEVAIGGPFTLVDQQGHAVSDSDFRGKLMLIYFGYTFCPDVCPTTLGSVIRAYDLLKPEEQAKTVPIFVTVDPERDTVDQMAQYVGNFSPALVGLTGSPEQIAKVLKEYRVYARKAEGQGGNYSMDHSSILYLMDREGKFAAHLPGNASPEEIAAGIRKQLAHG